MYTKSTLNTPHRKYRKTARRLYRLLIVCCALALILAVLLWYFGAQV
ncbi:hypothetical protein [Robiginitalea sediminis]|nr:hypothetical protein [Robiginitalea sediminis]